MLNNENNLIMSTPLLPPLEITQYGSSAKTASNIMHRSPLVLNDKACLVVRNSNTVYKNGKPSIERYEIRIMSSCTNVAQTLSDGTWRTFKEFRWLRKFLQKQYRNEKIPCLPPNYLFRRNYDQDVVNERIKGLHEFLDECLQLRNIVSDLTFHLFVQSEFTIEEIKRQQANKNHLFLMCFWVCGRQTKEENDEITILGDDDDDEIDYIEFKKELAEFLKGNKGVEEEEEKDDSTYENPY